MLPVLLLAVWNRPAAAQAVFPRLEIGVTPVEGPEGVASSLQILALLTVLALAPSILVMLTSFTRIVIVLSFLRSALGTGQVPPNAVLVGLALFLTAFTMAPTVDRLYDEAWRPFEQGEVSQDEALRRAEGPLRDFMLRHTRERDLALFIEMSDSPRPEGPEAVTLTQMVPAFVISELKTAFEMGFVLFIPFLVVDMIVSATLMSMGMWMLPPTLISLPFKVLLFVVADGWNLVVRSLVLSFR